MPPGNCALTDGGRTKLDIEPESGLLLKPALPVAIYHHQTPDCRPQTTAPAGLPARRCLDIARAASGDGIHRRLLRSRTRRLLSPPAQKNAAYRMPMLSLLPGAASESG